MKILCRVFRGGPILLVRNRGLWLVRDRVRGRLHRRIVRIVVETRAMVSLCLFLWFWVLGEGGVCRSRVCILVGAVYVSIL